MQITRFNQPDAKDALHRNEIVQNMSSIYPRNKKFHSGNDDIKPIFVCLDNIARYLHQNRSICISIYIYIYIYIYLFLLVDRDLSFIYMHINVATSITLSRFTEHI